MFSLKKISATFAFLTLLAGSSWAEASTIYLYRQFLSGNPIACTTPGSQTFTTPGVYQVTVPSGCDIAVTLAGAGGGNAYDNEGGGSGGLVSFTIHPGSTQLTVVVGQAGSIAYPSVQNSGGTGGGYSLVAEGSTILGVAGGGGGAGGDGGSGHPAYSQGGEGGDPGTDGALAAYDYDGCIDNGTGATDLQAGTDGEMCPEVNTGLGAAPATAGSAALESGSFTADSGTATVYQGDSGNGGNGGGGGGYYGGGSGSPGGGYGEGGGGGGGSSYVTSSATNVKENTGEGSPAGENGAVTLSW